MRERVFELGKEKTEWEEMESGRGRREKKKDKSPGPTSAGQTAHIAPVRPPGPCRLCTALAQAGNPHTIKFNKKLIFGAIFEMCEFKYC